MSEDLIKVVVDYKSAKKSQRKNTPTGKFKCIHKSKRKIDKPKESMALALRLEGKQIQTKNKVWCGRERGGCYCCRRRRWHPTTRCARPDHRSRRPLPSLWHPALAPIYIYGGEMAGRGKRTRKLTRTVLLVWLLLRGKRTWTNTRVKPCHVFFTGINVFDQSFVQKNNEKKKGLFATVHPLLFRSYQYLAWITSRSQIDRSA